MSLRQVWWVRMLQLSYGKIFLVSLIPRIALLGYLYPELLLGDAQYYWEEAIQLSLGEKPSFYWPPLLPFWLSGWIRILGVHTWVAAWASLCLWGAFFMVFARQKELKDEARKGLLILFSFYPAFIYQSIVPLSQLPMALLILMAMRAWLKHARSYEFILAGVLVGLTALLRPASLSIWPVLAMMPTSLGVRSRFLWLIPALLLVLGWVQYVQLQTGQWILVNQASSYNLFIGNHPNSPHYKNWWLGSHLSRGDPQFEDYYQTLDSIRSLPAATQDRAFQEAARSYVIQEPLTFLRRAWNRMKVFWTFDTLAGASLSKFDPILGLFLLGLDALLFMLFLGWVLGGMIDQKSLSKRQGVLIGLVLSYQLPYLLAFSHPSYHLPVLVILALMPHSFSSPAGVSSRAKRIWLGAMVGLLLIQAEWIWHMSGSL
ncbi:MAG: hypothetical protein AAF804_00410 [Bacteroidota bacterium]